MPQLIFLNAAAGLSPENCAMTSEIALRLLAHARLCREVARESHCDTMAETLHKLAEDCVQAARIVDFSALEWNSSISSSA
jgi:hypothetical protein